ncbi:DinB/UmuC family translesion DNA polymerase [Streptomyces ficellus]|uniref:DinB/UmuC family translesion DNA polymerase n=1 Tax=Streptomyces ficellus TaxID=1977088 RepID=UPI00338D9DFC
MQRVLGGKADRLLRERPAELTAAGWCRPGCRTARRAALLPDRYSGPELVHSALLSLAVELGERLRTRQQAAKGVTLTVTFADRTQIHRSRPLPGGPSAHTDDLSDAGYETPRGPNSPSQALEASGQVLSSSNRVSPILMSSAVVRGGAAQFWSCAC